jgi:hypothetical protein
VPGRAKMLWREWRQIYNFFKCKFFPKSYGNPSTPPPHTLFSERKALD